MSLSLKEYIQKSREAVAANLAKGNKHASLLSRLYSDPYRFLDEILQNAEDAYARKGDNCAQGSIGFYLTDDGLDIVHNGIDFTEEDLKAITTFAGTTKDLRDGINQIGKFGIGFRSVYALTDVPEIHSGLYHFRIEDYEVLEECTPQLAPSNAGTLIRLPFRESEKQKSLKWVREGLDRLNAYSLLFLKNINTIEIFFRGKLRRTLSCSTTLLSPNIFRLLIADTIKKNQCVEYLMLRPEAKGNAHDYAMAFRLQERPVGKWQIVREENPYLFVYFSTQQESHLGFLLHARFTTTPTREAVPFDQERTPENLKLLAKAASLLSQSIVPLRKLGFVDASFFDVLPIKTDIAHSQDHLVQLFHREVLSILQQKCVIPLQNGHHGFAKDIVYSNEQAITELLDAKALQNLYQRSFWLHHDFRARPSLTMGLANACEIKEVDHRGLAFRIAVKPEFLKARHHAWFLLFYAFLAEHPELWDLLHKNEHYNLRYKPIIRLKSGENVMAFDSNNKLCVYFPSGKRSKPADVHPLLLKDEAAVSFLQMLGLRADHNLGIEAENAVAAEPCIMVPIMKDLEHLLKNADPFQGILNWALEFGLRWMDQVYKQGKWIRTHSGSAQLKRIGGNGPRTVYIAFRKTNEHRFQMPVMDWTALCDEVDDEALLLMISGVGCDEPEVQLIAHPSQLIKKGRFISDPMGFNFLDSND